MGLGLGGLGGGLLFVGDRAVGEWRKEGLTNEPLFMYWITVSMF